MKKRVLFLIPFLIALSVALFYLLPGTRKLDEAVFYQGPNFRLKVVRYHENLPLHYVGEVFRVLCRSANTSHSPSHATQEAGWVTLANGVAIGTANAQDVVKQVRDNYIVANENTIISKGINFSVSFDACGSFRFWDPSTLASEIVNPAPKPEYCAPIGTADCRYYDFQDDRKPVYGDVRVNGAGAVSFSVRSKSFGEGTIFDVESDDYAQTWKVKRRAG